MSRLGRHCGIAGDRTWQLHSPERSNRCASARAIPSTAGILAITKGLLQSGVAYMGGYQGAPVSHLLDAMVQARNYMEELGVHVEACSNEASDALSNLAAPGVTGGALIRTSLPAPGSTACATAR